MDAEKVAELAQNVRDNTRRIEQLENMQMEIRSLTTSVAVMAERLGGMENDISTVTASVKVMEEKSGKRWDNLVEKLIWLVVGGIVTLALGQAGII